MKFQVPQTIRLTKVRSFEGEEFYYLKAGDILTIQKGLTKEKMKCSTVMTISPIGGNPVYVKESQEEILRLIKESSRSNEVGS